MVHCVAVEAYQWQPAITCKYADAADARKVPTHDLAQHALHTSCVDMSMNRV